MSRILIVEDENVLSSAFRLILERAGHTVEVARDGLEALDISPQFEPDLILLDLLMPNMGGIEFLEKYFAEEANVGKKVIVLSNLHDSKTVEQTLELGAKEYIVKSQMTPSTLTELAAKWLTA